MYFAFRPQTTPSKHKTQTISGSQSHSHPPRLDTGDDRQRLELGAGFVDDAALACRFTMVAVDKFDGADASDEAAAALVVPGAFVSPTEVHCVAPRAPGDAGTVTLRSLRSRR